MYAALLFTLEVVDGGSSPISAAMTFLKGRLVDGGTFALVGVISALPFAVLLSVCLLVARKAPMARVACIGIGGLFGTLAVMVPGNIVSWLSATQATPVAGAAVLNEVFLPLVTLMGLGIGLTAGWVASLLPRFNRSI